MGIDIDMKPLRTLREKLVSQRVAIVARMNAIQVVSAEDEVMRDYDRVTAAIRSIDNVLVDFPE